MTSRTGQAGPVGARKHNAGVADDEPAPTVLDRLIAAGLSEQRIADHMSAGRVRVDGELSPT